MPPTAKTKWTAKKAIAKPRQTSVKVQPKVQPKATKTVKKQTDDMKIGTNLFSNLNSNIEIKLGVDKPKVEKSIKDEKLVAVTTEIETNDNNIITDERFKNLKIGTKWTHEDTDMLNKLYLVDKLDFMSIVAKMGRSKRTIIDKLEEHGIQKDVAKIRGGVDAFDTSDYAKLLDDYYNYRKMQRRKKIKGDNQIVKRVKKEDKYIQAITELNDNIKNMDNKIKLLDDNVAIMSISIESLVRQIAELSCKFDNVTNPTKNDNIKSLNDTIIQEKKEIKHKNGNTYVVYGNDVFLENGIYVGEYKNNKIVFMKY